MTPPCRDRHELAGRWQRLAERDQLRIATIGVVRVAGAPAGDGPIAPPKGAGVIGTRRKVGELAGRQIRNQAARVAAPAMQRPVFPQTATEAVARRNTREWSDLFAGRDGQVFGGPKQRMERLLLRRHSC